MAMHGCLPCLTQVSMKPKSAPNSATHSEKINTTVQYNTKVNGDMRDFVLLKVAQDDMHKLPDPPLITCEVKQGGQYVLVGASANNRLVPLSSRHGVVLSALPDKDLHIKGDTLSYPGDSGGGCFSVTDGTLFAINLGCWRGSSALLPVSVPLAQVKAITRAA